MMLTVSDLSVARGGVLLLEGVGFHLSPGQALILRGPNGIGKTTLLRTIAGLQRPVAGEVRAAGDAIAYSGHADALKATLTVAENLAFWAAIFGTRGIDDAMAAMRIADLARRPAGTLSAGQKRRLGLARMLVTGRPVWLMDEPTVSLDVDSVALFGDAVRGHLARGGAALMATHVDLGLPDAAVLDLTAWRVARGAAAPGGFDEAFA